MPEQHHAKDEHRAEKPRIPPEIEAEIRRLIDSPNVDEWARAVLKLGLDAEPGEELVLPPRPPLDNDFDYFFI